MIQIPYWPACVRVGRARASLLGVGRGVLIAMLAAMSGLPAWAGQLGTPALTPSRITAGTAATITVSVSITDPNYTAGSANFLRLKPDGSTPTQLGVLRDDGTQGDAVAGDKVYTLSLSLNEAVAGTVQLQVSAAYKKELKRTLSAPLMLTVESAQTIPTLGEVTLSPSTTAAGLALASTVRAEITDTRLVPGSVALQKLDASGAVIGTIGTLNDEGRDGDATAGDRSFGLRTTVLENTPGVVSYRVAAAFDGYAQMVYSTPLRVTITGTATGISITSPANGAYLNTPVITLSGAVGDPTAQVTVNGIAVPVSGGAFATSVPLNEGPNIVTAVATNSNGSSNTASSLITLDTTPPRVEIYSPAASGQTAAGTVTVTGLVNDIVVGTVNPQQATVTVNGVRAEVLNRSFMARDVPLSAGVNTVQAVAVDRAGNRATTAIALTRVAASEAGLGVLSGNNQSAPARSVLPSPLVVKWLNAQGQPQVGKPVVFRVIGQDGHVGLTPAPNTGLSAIAVNTDGQGLARVFFQLGSRAGVGNNLVEASVAGVPATADFSATATPGGPQLVVVDSGNNQTGVVGQPLPLPFIGIVTDANNNRLANVPVTFEVKDGNGSFGTGAERGSKFLTSSDSDGRVAATLTLGPDQGVNNNVVELSFSGNTGYAAAFAATGLVPGPLSQTRITGVVLDNSNQPLPGVTMRLLQINQGNRSNIPQEMATAVRTDAQGQFLMQPVPVGIFKLMADGGTAERAGAWPTLDYDMITVAGQNNVLGMPVYLPELHLNNRVCVNESTGGTLTLAEAPGFALTIAPGSATFPGGSRSGCVSVTPVNMDKVPMSPGFGQQPRFVVTIQPVGTHFNPPARMTIPNVDGLAPRAVTEMYSYDHDLATFVAIGSATVSGDGSSITSDLGSGVIKAGWHCGGNPNTTGSAGTCPTCKKCEGSSCVPTPGACDDKDVCTRNDRCENGVCTGDPIDTSSWVDDLSVQADVKLDKSIVEKINKVFNYIPGLGGVKFKDARVGVSGKAKNCCDKDDGIKEMGMKEGQGTFQLTAEVANIPLWGSPTFSKEIDFNVLIISVDVQVGAFFTTNFRVNAQGGYRKSSCKPVQECLFGEANVSLDPEIKTTFEAILCQESLWTTKTCGGVTITPLAVRANFSGRVTYNKPDCGSGLDGSLALGKVVLRAEFSLDIPAAPQRVVIQYEIFGGVGQL